MRPIQKSTIVLFLRLSSLLLSDWCAFNIMQSLASISMRPIPMISRPCLTDCAHPDQKRPICGVFLPALLMQLGSMAIAHLPCLPKKRLASETLSLSQSMLFDFFKPNALRQVCSTCEPYLPIWVKFIFLGITMNKIITSMSIFSKLFVNFAAESSTASLKISIYWSSPVFI